MGFKDLQVLVLLVWLCLGHMFEVGAQEEVPSVPRSSTGWDHWNVTGNPTSLERPFTTILTSSNKTFSFDLMLTNQSKSSCAAIVRHNPSNTTVWVANFNVNSPNEQYYTSNSTVKCFLHFTEDVGLMLNNTNDNKEIWSTRGLNQSSRRFDTLQLEETGCLYIRDKNVLELRKSVWTSFGYPADTLIKGQQLRPGTSMGSAQLNQEYSTGGIFYMQVDGASLTLKQDFKVSGTPLFIYWSFDITQNISYVALKNGLSAYENKNISHSIPFSNETNWDYARLEPNGGLMLNTYDSLRSRELVELGSGGVCSLPARCGSFGECLQNGTCTCPEGFEQVKITDDFTCQRLPALNTTSLDCNSYTKFVNITGQTYFSISNISAPDDINDTTCKSLCHGNCSCTNALHVRRNMLNPLGACFFNLDSMQTIRQAADNGGDLQTLFLRINGTEVITPPGGGGTSSRRIAASVFAGGAGALALVLFALSAWWLVQNRRKYFDEADRGLHDPATAGMAPSQLPPAYTYKQLVESTGDFAQRLGYGGMSSVYAGNLPDTNTKIAVKNLDDNGHKDKEFLAAVATMGSLSHPNLVPLVGFCKEGKHKLIVYELVNEGRSLNWFLFNTHDSGPLLDASTRRAIASGTARGLQYLHEDYNTGGVTHGGVKPENIMIDRARHPKLVDYGLVNLKSRFQSLHAADSRGCREYMAPEWVSNAPVTEKVDVYSLGVVILELVSGRRCLIPDATPEEKRFLPTWGFSLLHHGNNDPDSLLELVDPRLDLMSLSEIDQQVLKGMTYVALWCVQMDPSLRPSMNQVVRMLEGDQPANIPPPSPALDAFARDLCASQQDGEQPGFVHSPSLSENSDMRPR